MSNSINKIDKEKGFIVLYRQIEDNWLWLSEPFTKSQAWIDLLLMTNHKDGAFFLRGIKVEVKRGQLARGEENLSSRWKWSKGKVRKFLKLLESEQQIELHRSNKINIIEVLNYDSYQKVTNRVTNKKTTERLQTDQQNDSNNNENNDNNDNNVNKDEEFEKFWNLYNYKKSEKKARESFAVALTKTTFEKIIAGIDYTVKDREGSPEKFWICPVKWLDNERWNDSGSEKVPITIKATQHTISAVKRTQIIVDHCKKNLIHPDSLSNEEKQNIIKNNK